MYDKLCIIMLLYWINIKTFTHIEKYKDNVHHKHLYPILLLYKSLISKFGKISQTYFLCQFHFYYNN